MPRAKYGVRKGKGKERKPLVGFLSLWLISETVAVLAASPAVVRYSASNTPRQWMPWSSLGTGKVRIAEARLMMY